MEKLRVVMALPVEEQQQAALEWFGAPHSLPSRVFVLGCEHSMLKAVLLLEHVVSICRMTYRTEFSAVGGFSTDVGWGCMMRTGQMSVANALIRIYLKAEWRLPHVESPDILSQYCQILRVFADDWRAPLSIQNFANEGTHLDKTVGQWFGPTTTCHVVRRLVTTHLSKQLSVIVAQDGVLSLPECDSVSNGWLRPLVVYVPLRLGLNQVDLSLAALATQTLSWPQSVGILGGKPRSSFYFIGYHGDTLLYVDPHFAQPSIDMSPATFSIDSHHSSQVGHMQLNELDPSLALCFVCFSKADLLDLKQRVLSQSTRGKLGCLFIFSEDKTHSFAYLDENTTTTNTNTNATPATTSETQAHNTPPQFEGNTPPSANNTTTHSAESNNDPEEDWDML